MKEEEEEGIINTCLKEEEKVSLMNEESEMPVEIPQSLASSTVLNMLSKETLEIIKKVTSNSVKPTPSSNNFCLLQQSKRVNSQKPTPSLEMKLQEL